MKQIVCIKQVPEIEHLKFDPQLKRLVREGVPNEINPFDKRAITEAINARKKFGGEVIVITMGPPQAREALVEALALGCDRAIHLNDRAFAGADSLATARALAVVIRPLAPDIIWCGKYSIDAETAQVPPMLAELLDLPQVMGVTRIEYDVDGKNLTITRELDDGFETVQVNAPVVLSAAERLCKPLRAKPEDLEPARAKPIQTIHASELGDVSQFGVAGSPTWVEAIQAVEHARKKTIRTVNGNSEAVVAEVLADLKAEGVFDDAANDERKRKRVFDRSSSFNDGQSEIWVVAEIIEDEIRPVTYELLGGALDLAEKKNAQVNAVVIGYNVARFHKTLAAHGAEKIYAADDAALANYSTDAYASILADAIRAYKPWAVLLPSTANGRDLAPRVAARLGIGLTGDAIGLEVNEAGQLVMLKPAFGGNIVAPILTKTAPAMVTLRAGMMTTREPNPSRDAQIVPLKTNLPTPRMKFVSSERKDEEGVALDEAEIVIGVGMGVGGPENLPIVYDLAHAWHAHIGASRRVVDAGWLPRQQQVGLTGRAISPRLYVALGIRGAFNHTVGIQRAGTILAINNDPEAAIFKMCDYGIVGDWREVVEAIMKLTREKIHA